MTLKWEQPPALQWLGTPQVGVGLTDDTLLKRCAPGAENLPEGDRKDALSACREQVNAIKGRARRILKSAQNLVTFAQAKGNDIGKLLVDIEVDVKAFKCGDAQTKKTSAEDIFNELFPMTQRLVGNSQELDSLLSESFFDEEVITIRNQVGAFLVSVETILESSGADLAIIRSKVASCGAAPGPGPAPAPEPKAAAVPARKSKWGIFLLALAALGAIVSKRVGL